jgi:DNA-binding IclR family transcriptional regulator
MLEILDLFDLDQPFWTSEQIIERTGFTRPTTFRYIKELRNAGLIARFAGGYVLGAKAVKLDYIIRQSDPLLHLFEPIMEEVRDETDCDVILASLLGHDLFATIHAQSMSNNVSWPRGRPMPLTRGAGGLAVLSALPKTQLARLLDLPPIAATISDRAALLSQIGEVARDDCAISLGALEPENVGIAVSVKLTGVPPTALVMIMSRKRFSTTDRPLIVAILRDARKRMTKAYAALEADNGG